MGSKWICVVVIMWVSIDGGWCHGCWEQERVALLQLKPFFNRLNWLEGDNTSDCCKWERVECSPSTGRVITLILNERRGLHLPVLYINASLFLPFEELKELYLEFNNIVGCIENEGFEILSSKLKNLEMLDLGLNGFNNNILSSLRGLTSLKILNLDYNQLKGTIHTNELDGLKNLKKLYMYRNKIEGFRSLQGSEILSSKLRNLEVLDLGVNQFNNSILSSLSGLSSLKVLYVDGNQLKGTIHSHDKRTLKKLKVLHLGSQRINRSIQLQSLELGNLSALEELYLDRFTLRTNFLQSIGSLTSLKVLSLENCGLNGILPNQGLCELNNLQGLYLSDNELEGTLPPCLGNLSSLRYMDISSNQFKGNLGSTPIPNLISLVVLDLSNNHIEVPMSLRPLTNLSNLTHFSADSIVQDLDSQFWTPRFQLQSLSFGSSLFKKSKPHDLPNFLYYQTDLRYIVLFSCEFGGVFPNWLLQNNTSLYDIHLSGNYFTGPLLLPSHSNLNLYQMNISDNQLQGQIPTNISDIFPNLQSLSMFANSFHGEIPASLGEMESLTYLDLSSNQFSGGIAWPSDKIFNYMFIIDLSCNKLSGEIPAEFGKLSNIKYLNLSHNNLTGRIPTTLANLKQIESLDLSYNYLIGLIPPQLTELNFLAIFRVSHNNLSGPLPDRKNQFITFDESSYEGNRFLCGPPLTESCKETVSALPSQNAFLDEDEDDNWMDTNDFYVSFVVSYVMALLGLAAVLYVNPYWRQAWFYQIEVCITAHYYFMKDNSWNV